MNYKLMHWFKLQLGFYGHESAEVNEDMQSGALLVGKHGSCGDP